MACCKARPSSNLGSAFHGGSTHWAYSSEEMEMGLSECLWTMYECIYWIKGKIKRVSYGHQTFLFFKNIGENLALWKHGLPFSIHLFVLGNSLQINFILKTSVADPDPNPDPSDLYVFGPPGSGPGSGSFYHQAKIVRKTLNPTALWLLFDFYLWKMM